MAKAEAYSWEPVPPPPEVRIKLDLNYDEAATLRLLMRNICGDPNRTRRGHADAIEWALGKAGVEVLDAAKLLDAGVRAIFFKNQNED